MTSFLKAKYVEGRYLSDQDRQRFGLPSNTAASGTGGTRFMEG